MATVPGGSHLTSVVTGFREFFSTTYGYVAAYTSRLSSVPLVNRAGKLLN